MKPAARIQAAIDVMANILERHQPAALALADWGKAHRFAGSGDRSAIGNIVYDALRHRAFSAYHMRSDNPRALGHRGARAVVKLDIKRFQKFHQAAVKEFRVNIEAAHDDQ